ncbi:hypothetical protein FISHEDRAFT_54981 [Fistulina hepatica ATCC 64428]|uniref:Uncharacterized protein n=1 Tax=Fistulina hepatica ATCC 64428 TaxID=1128425 RepID=A0A0D7ASF8_9AGAR|nr:hypothetical protein FISHEDRAFT_54981 [Fistulina hepatica ATCC 64428]
MSEYTRSFNVGYQLGSLLLGLVVVSILYGITLVQSHRYFKKCKSDPLPLKLYVFVLWILDTVHLGFEVWGNYYYLVGSYEHLFFPSGLTELSVKITHFGDEETYRDETRSLGHMVRCASLVRDHSPLTMTLQLGNQVAVITILLCQLLLVLRAWNYARAPILFFTCLTGIHPATLCLGAIFYRTMSNGHTIIIRKIMKDLLYAGLSTGMAADILIAVVLCVQLKDSRVGLKRCPDHSIVWPETNILMAALSTLSILAVLNGRPKLREKLMYSSGHDVTWEVGHIPTASGGTLSTTSGQFCSSGTISVHVNESAQSDEMDKAKAG